MIEKPLDLLQKLKKISEELSHHALLMKKQAEASKSLAKALKQMLDAYKL